MFAGDPGEKLHPQPAEEGLAEGALQPREVGRGAEWQEDGAAGCRDLGRNPTGRVGPMTDTLFMAQLKKKKKTFFTKTLIYLL